MRNIVKVSLALAAMAAALGGCTKQLVYVTAVYPAVQQVQQWPANVRNVVVLPLAPDPNSPQSSGYSDLAASVVADRLNQTVGSQDGSRIAIKPVTSGDLVRAPGLGAADLTDPKTAIAAGKAFNADGVIFGTVAVQQQDKAGQLAPPPPAPPGVPMPPGTPQAPPVATIDRQVTASLTIRMISPATGQKLMPDLVMPGGRYDSGDVPQPPPGLPPAAGGPRLLSMDDATASALQQAVSGLNFGGGPAQDTFTVELFSGKTGLAKAGLKLAEQGQWADAAKDFQDGIAEQPGDTAAMYDLGVMILMQGNLADAKAQIDKVVTLKRDTKYLMLQDHLATLLETNGVTVRPATSAEAAQYDQQTGKKPKKPKNPANAP